MWGQRYFLPRPGTPGRGPWEQPEWNRRASVLRRAVVVQSRRILRRFVKTARREPRPPTDYRPAWITFRCDLFRLLPSSGLSATFSPQGRRRNPEGTDTHCWASQQWHPISRTPTPGWPRLLVNLGERSESEASPNPPSSQSDHDHYGSAGASPSHRQSPLEQPLIR